MHPKDLTENHARKLEHDMVRMTPAQLKSIWMEANRHIAWLRSGTRRNSQVGLRRRWRRVRDKSSHQWHRLQG